MSLSVQLQCVSCLPVLLTQPFAQSPIGATGFQAPPRGPCAELHYTLMISGTWRSTMNFTMSKLNFAKQITFFNYYN